MDWSAEQGLLLGTHTCELLLVRAALPRPLAKQEVEGDNQPPDRVYLIHKQQQLQTTPNKDMHKQDQETNKQQHTR